MEKKGIAAIVLAAGRGTRMNSHLVNKVTVPFLDKPLIVYSIELLQPIVQNLVIVLGAFEESVKNCLKNFEVIFANQEDQLGTGHAVRAGLKALENINPSLILVGYGDHMMFYRQQTIAKFVEFHRSQNATISLLTADHPQVDKFRWGRIIRDKDNFVKAIVEQKDATLEEREIKEFNPGFYCFDPDFLRTSIDKIEKSPVTGEYYVTDLVEIAVKQGKKVAAFKIPFEEVGIGVNVKEELEESQQIYKSRNITH